MRRLIGLLATPILLLALTTPALSISYGSPDTANTYSNTGALIVDFGPDGKFIVCSGTLISPTIFLTAAHCIFAGPTVWVSFQNEVPHNADGSVAAAAVLHQGTAHPHPRFACCGASDTFDIAVVQFAAPIAGITPATLPGFNDLGEMSAKQLKQAQFVAAGYGALRDTRRQGWQSLYDGRGVRHFATQTFNSLNKAWVTFSMNQATGDGGTCYGDSGGPHFLGSTVVALTVTGDRWCKSTDKSYRLDTQVARDFLDDWVTLPA